MSWRIGLAIIAAVAVLCGLLLLAENALIEWLLYEWEVR